MPFVAKCFSLRKLTAVNKPAVGEESAQCLVDGREEEASGWTCQSCKGPGLQTGAEKGESKNEALLLSKLGKFQTCFKCLLKCSNNVLKISILKLEGHWIVDNAVTAFGVIYLCGYIQFSLFCSFYTFAGNYWNLKVSHIRFLLFGSFTPHHGTSVIYQFTLSVPFSPLPLVQSHFSFSRCGSLGICLQDWHVEVGSFVVCINGSGS